MRLLIYEWNSYLQYDLKSVCKEKAIDFDCFSWKFVDKNRDDEFVYWFKKNIDNRKYNAIISINYWPMLSVVAEKNNIKYIAWCYDNPLNIISIEETLGNEKNEVFFFDRVQYSKYCNLGFKTVHYIPLGVNKSRYEKMVVSKLEYERYNAQISFVGSLYESKLGEIKSILNEYECGYVDSIVDAQQDLYGCYLFDSAITDDFVTNINTRIVEEHPNTKFHLLAEALRFAMASEVTRRDRMVLLSLCGRRYDTHLYSFQKSEVLNCVICHPAVDYVEEMPKVFRCSKVNLNPILKCIQSGIPLRALDIMGSGGFLMSCYQPELNEQFIDSKEMVTYDNYQDAIEKIDFYLRNDSIREKICKEGRRKVLENYTIQDRLDEILKQSDI